jgi:RNA-directed DNA polymerase
VVRRAGNLYARIADTENLLVAFHAARRGKRDRHAIRRFEADLDGNIARLRAGLLAERVRWHGYRMFEIRDPKPRRIAAPAFSDRVLHHAIIQVIEPDLERVAVFDSYACRTGKGLFRAIERAQGFARRHEWFLQLDVRKYFDSIDHAVLRRRLERRFKDRALVRLMGGLLESYETAPGKGLPIGALTSQHLANFYLAPLDHFAKEVLRAPGYVRYMDDFVLFARECEVLVDWRARIGEFLRTECALELKNSGALDETRSGIGYLGMLVLPTHVRLMGKPKRRVRAKFRALVDEFAAGALAADDLARRSTALLARTHHVKARGLRARWLAEFADVEA